MVSGEATGLQRGAFRYPCLCNRIRMGYLGLCDLGSQAPPQEIQAGKRCWISLAKHLGSGSKTGEREAQGKGQQRGDRRSGSEARQDKNKLGNLVLT